MSDPKNIYSKVRTRPQCELYGRRRRWIEQEQELAMTTKRVPYE